MNNSHTSQNIWYILGLAFMFFAVTLPEGFHAIDQWFWLSWSDYILDHGIGNIYSLEGANYPPLYYYILSIFGKVAPKSPVQYEGLLTVARLLKLFTLVFDFAAIALLVRLLNFGKMNPTLSLVVLLNIAYLYNTYIWGQVDAIHTFFLFATFIAIFQNRTLLSVLLFTVGIYMKFQSIIFLPPLLFLLIPKFIRSPILFPKAILTTSVVQVIILLPFLFTNSIGAALGTFGASVDYFPVLSMNAANIWQLLFKSNPMQVSDSGMWLFFSYKTWGLILFCLTSFLALFPMFLNELKRFLTGEQLDLQRFAQYSLSIGLVVVCFFFFNTQMHERYVHPAIIFLGCHAIISKKWWCYAIISVGYFINLEQVLRFFHWGGDFYITYMGFEGNALIFIAGIGVGFFYLYQNFRSNFDILIFKKLLIHGRTKTASPS